MKMAMTALAVVFLAQAAPALAQDTPDRPRAVDPDRPHRDGGRGFSQPAPSPEARPAPAPRPAPAAPTAPAASEPRGGHWSPAAGGYPGHGGTWTRGDTHNVQPTPPPATAPAPQVRTDRGDRYTGGRTDGDRRNPDWRGGDSRDRTWDHDRDRDRDHDRDRYRDGDHRDGDRRDRQDWGRYQGDTRNWGRYDQDRRWAGHDEWRRWDRTRYPPIYVSPHRYRGYAWRPPSGYYVRSWAFGEFLPRGWYGPEWYIDEPWDFDLPLPPPGYEWVRVGYDAIMIDEYTGRIVQVVRNVFW